MWGECISIYMLFGGRYRKSEPPKLVGRGSYKTVFMGTEVDTGKRVAWCEMNPVEHASGRGRSSEATANAWKVAREEIRMLTTLRHPHIATFLDSDVCEDTGHIVLVMEYFEGGTLRTHASRLAAVADRSIAKWMRQVLIALEHMHGLDPPVVHRDIKSDNLFVSIDENGEETVKVGDMGLCSLVKRGETNKIRTLAGTPAFMAPELYDEVYDCKVDIWSFGMAMLEIRTGRIPYAECKNIAQIYRKVTSGRPPASMSALPRGDLRDAIESCICFDPRRRPTASELLGHVFFRDEISRDVETESISYAAFVTPIARRLW